MGDFGNYGMGGGMGGSDFGNSGGGGGGFMQSGNNNFGGGMNPSQSSQGQGVDGEQRLTNTTPCSIGMLMKAEESNNAFVVDGRPASRVTFYGRVLDMEAKATNMRYVLDDGSGVIEVTNWNNMDTGAEVLQTSPVNVGNYVAVVGQIRSFNNKVQINAFNLRVVQDMNELTHHFLEVISAHVQVHKGPLNPALRVSQQQPQQQMQPQHSSVLGDMTMNGGAQPIQMNTNMQMGGNDESNLNNVQQMVMNAFSNDPSETGRSVNEVAGMLQAQGISQQDVMHTVEALANEGHLYSTIDEYHYKSTQCQET